MKNPIGPYPGRQIFLGKTIKGAPCFAYLITGRSPESRQRKATKVDNAIRIGPLGNQAYDPLRHYNAVKFDSSSGVLCVSNGIQTDACYEIYKLLFATDANPGKEYLQTTLEGAGAEPDSYHTPRIAGVITFNNKQTAGFIGIKSYGARAKSWQINLEPGKLTGISTYTGTLDSPQATNPDFALPVVDFTAKTAAELSKFIFDISGL